MAFDRIEHVSDTLQRVDMEAAIAAAHRAVDVLLAGDLSPYTDERATALLRDTERLRHRLAAVDHAQILDVERRGMAVAAGMRTVPRLLSQLLDLDPGEARARHRAAEAAGARRSLTGEPVAPAYPVVARAQADGELSPRQARVITECVEKLPDAVKHEGPGVEARLVGFARDLHLAPHDLALAAQRETDWLDSLAAPKPAADGVQDPRTPGQRRHDALVDLAKFAVRTGDLPDAGGVTTTVVLTMTEDQFTTGEGFARTGHGAQVPVREALSWSGGDTRVMAVVLDSMQAVVAYSTCHRFFTEGQRLAMSARDGGCAFPSCTAPPGWTQAHHVTEWQYTLRTSVDDGCLLCGYHHREFERLGWQVVMTDGRPTWTPPRWLDPQQRPIRT